MKYVAETEEGRQEVRIEEQEDGTFRLFLNGGSRLVDYRRVGPKTGSVLIDGQSHLLTFEEEGEARVAVTDGVRRLTVRVRDEQEAVLDALLGRRLGASGEGLVKSVMPGKILALNVSEGDRIAVDAPLLIMEAMKMENEVRAETGGVVAKIFVSEGDTVGAGDKLVEIQPDET